MRTHDVSQRPLALRVAFGLGVAGGLLCGCPSSEESAPKQSPAPVDAAKQQKARVPSCDAAKIDGIVKTLASNKEGWSAARGVLPDFAGYVAAALWKTCDLGPGERYLLVTTMHIPAAPWEEAGEAKPQGATHPIEAAMPGFDEVRTSKNAGPALAAVQDAVCPGRRKAVKRFATLPAEERPGAVYDACKLDASIFTREEFVAHELGFEAVGFVGLHGWLVEAGVTADEARTLVRSLAFDGPPDLQPTKAFSPPSRLRLPALKQGQVPRQSEVVYIGPEAIVIDGVRHKELGPKATAAALLSPPGMQHVIDGMATALGTAHGTLSLVFDRATSWEVAAVVLAATGSARAERVDALGLGPDVTSPLRRVALHEPFEGDPTLRIDVKASGVVVTCGDAQHEGALDDVATTIESCGAAADAPAEYRVEGSIPASVVFGVLDALGDRPRRAGTVD